MFKYATNRLDLQHNLFLLTFGDKLGLAPPNDPTAEVRRVLDLGTGTGIWAIDYADEHPEVEVEISPYNSTRVSTDCIGHWSRSFANSARFVSTNMIIEDPLTSLVFRQTLASLLTILTKIGNMVSHLTISIAE